MNPLDPLPLPHGVQSRTVDNGNGLQMHCLESGHQTPGRPLILLLHGFPELAFSWRHQLLPLAAAGFHVVAPDQRGYGRTTGGDARYDGDVAGSRMLNLVEDVRGLVRALGYRDVAAVVGHDFGAPVAAWCALLHPDVFRSVALMSAPFAGPPAAASTSLESVLADLAALARPRKHYQWYYATREANGDLHGAPQGVHDFLRAYYHHKSADWKGNRPHALPGATAQALAILPTYYVMDAAQDMATTVAAEMPDAAAIAACAWLPEPTLRVYSAEYERTGFQGGLQWYRCATSTALAGELRAHAGRTIDVPAVFIAGRQDWGVYQAPGAFEAMQERACTALRGVHLVDGAGHWVQQEQPAEVTRLLLGFLDSR